MVEAIRFLQGPLLLQWYHPLKMGSCADRLDPVLSSQAEA